MYVSDFLGLLGTLGPSHLEVLGPCIAGCGLCASQAHPQRFSSTPTALLSQPSPRSALSLVSRRAGLICVLVQHCIQELEACVFLSCRLLCQFGLLFRPNEVPPADEHGARTQRAGHGDQSEHVHRRITSPVLVDVVQPKHSAKRTDRIWGNRVDVHQRQRERREALGQFGFEMQ
eukprot:scaffold748_cov251-Pinguiococcus_pyrenoidosus.AAC.56